MIVRGRIVVVISTIEAHSAWSCSNKISSDVPSRWAGVGHDHRQHQELGLRRLGPTTGPLAFESLIGHVTQQRSGHPNHGVGTAAKAIGQHLGAFACAEAAHQLGFLAVAEPGGRHGAIAARSITVRAASRGHPAAGDGPLPRPRAGIIGGTGAERIDTSFRAPGRRHHPSSLSSAG